MSTVLLFFISEPAPDVVLARQRLLDVHAPPPPPLPPHAVRYFHGVGVARLLADVGRERDDKDVREEQRCIALVEGEHVQALLLQRRLDPVRQAVDGRGLELALKDVDVVVEVS